MTAGAFSCGGWSFQLLLTDLVAETVYALESFYEAPATRSAQLSVRL